jgi:sensor histidine kinase YesM
VRVLRLPPLLLQPIVENAIKHGIAPSAEGGEVRIVARTAERNGRTTLHVIVGDTGVGTTPGLLARGRIRGLGIASVERRLHGLYGPLASIEVTTAPDQGTTVELLLPTEAPARHADPSLTVH